MDSRTRRSSSTSRRLPCFMVIDPVFRTSFLRGRTAPFAPVEPCFRDKFPGGRQAIGYQPRPYIRQARLLRHRPRVEQFDGLGEPHQFAVAKYLRHSVPSVNVSQEVNAVEKTPKNRRFSRFFEQSNSTCAHCGASAERFACANIGISAAFCKRARAPRRIHHQDCRVVECAETRNGPPFLTN